MGQAKNRGTLEQRIEHAKAREQERLAEHAKAREQERLANTPAKPKSLTKLSVLAMAGLAVAASPIAFNQYPIVRKTNQRVWK